MIRRRMLWTAAAVAAGAWWLRPADRGGPPDERLAALARALADVPQQPVLVLDRARWRASAPPQGDRGSRYRPRGRS